jgi:hypothetical protein
MNSLFHQHVRNGEVLPFRTQHVFTLRTGTCTLPVTHTPSPFHFEEEHILTSQARACTYPSRQSIHLHSKQEHGIPRHSRACTYPSRQSKYLPQKRLGQEHALSLGRAGAVPGCEQRSLHTRISGRSNWACCNMRACHQLVRPRMVFHRYASSWDLNPTALPAFVVVTVCVLLVAPEVLATV